MRLFELLQLGEKELRLVGIAEYELDARLLLEYCSCKRRTEIFLDGGEEVSPQLVARYMELLERRKNREPLAYIFGEQEFWSLPFHVNHNVLIPRPETEFLLDRVFALTDSHILQQGVLLDLCCGSGVIATVLALETGREVVASDISYEALQVTRKNTRRHGVESLVLPVQGHLLAPFSEPETFSLIVANPPYVKSMDLAQSLSPEVAGYEPHIALDGGLQGLDLIRQIHEALPRVLRPGGHCFMEIGADQGAEVKNMFAGTRAGQAGFDQVDILVDYAGRERVVHVRLGH